MHDRRDPDPSSNPWNVGAVEVPREEGLAVPAPRGAFRAAVSTAGYLAGLVSRG
jgi:hypothetical protein